MPKYEKQLKDFLVLDRTCIKEARENAEEEDETEDLLRGKVVKVELKGQTISPWRGSKRSIPNHGRTKSARDDLILFYFR